MPPAILVECVVAEGRIHDVSMGQVNEGAVVGMVGEADAGYVVMALVLQTAFVDLQESVVAHEFAEVVGLDIIDVCPYTIGFQIGDVLVRRCVVSVSIELSALLAVLLP